MIVDFFRHGTGLSKGCLDYLLGEDRVREHAQVLSGDVELTAQLIDSSPFAKPEPCRKKSTIIWT